ncbi:MAG: hypothetical protein QN149_06485 [Armatimonadota bacterium]|nr:hypothetical protein [Armatimonadota bacterium]
MPEAPRPSPGPAAAEGPPGGAALPFTGEPLWMWPAIGVFLLGAGLMLRRYAGIRGRVKPPRE